MERTTPDDPPPNARSADPEDRPRGLPFEPPAWLVTGMAVIGVAALTVLGLHLIRLLFPLVGWYLRDTQQIGTTDLVPYGVAPFALALLAPLVIRLAGPRWTLVGASAATALLRVVAQGVDSPQALLWVAILGTTTFLWALPAAYSVARTYLAHAVALGLVADSTIRGISWTLDLVWMDGAVPLLTVVVLAALAVGAALLVPAPAVADGPRPGAALPMIALGPLLFLELLALQNQGWIATQTGWDWDLAFGLLAVGNLLFVLGVSVGRTLPGQGATGLIGGVLLLLVAAATGLSGVLYAVLLLAGKLGSGMALGALTAPVAPPDRTPGALAHGLSMAVGWLLLFVLAFGYYASYDVPLPLAQDILVIVAAALVTLFGLGASASTRPRGSAVWGVVAVVAVLLAVPALWARSDPLADVADADGTGYPVQVATYNVHSSYSTAGVQDLEALAQAIEETGADVIGFQEISRGWLLNGSTDIVEWLQRRLGFAHARFHATTADPVWGNAILSRFPLDDAEATTLPQGTSLLRRGVLQADVEIGGGAVLHLMVTHLHHTGDDLAALHEEQIATILEAWDQQPRTVLVGDFNAVPGAPQLRALFEAGFVDAWEEAGSGEGLTANAADPDVRIDYIFHTPDLRATSAEVIESQASDHFAVTASIDTVE